MYTYKETERNLSDITAWAYSENKEHQLNMKCKFNTDFVHMATLYYELFNRDVNHPRTKVDKRKKAVRLVCNKLIGLDGAE
jgi:hypothetical protein